MLPFTYFVYRAMLIRDTNQLEFYTYRGDETVRIVGRGDRIQRLGRIEPIVLSVVTELIREIAEENLASEADTAGSGMRGTVVGTILERGSAIAIAQADQEKVGDCQLATHTDGVAGTVLFRNILILLCEIVSVTKVVGRVKRSHSVIGELILRTHKRTLGDDEADASDGTERRAQFVFGKIVVRVVVRPLNGVMRGDIAVKRLLQVGIVGWCMEGGTDTQERDRLVNHSQLGIDTGS